MLYTIPATDFAKSSKNIRLLLNNSLITKEQNLQNVLFLADH